MDCPVCHQDHPPIGGGPGTVPAFVCPGPQPVEIPLKFKYRVFKPKSTHGSKSSNTGKPLRGTPPIGMPRLYRGKTSYK